MKILGIYSEYAFSRNPIRIEQNWMPEAGKEIDGMFSIRIGGYKAYESKTSMPMHIDVSDIVDSYIRPFPEPTINHDNHLQLLVDAQSMNEYLLEMELEYGSGDPSSIACYVLPGGISTQNYNILYKAGTDIFKSKLFKQNCNFFLTTRTNQWNIVIEESELYPLYFIVNQGESIVLTEQLNGNSITYGNLNYGVYALNIDAVRYWFFEEYGILPSEFDISRNGDYACRLTIKRAINSIEQYTLKFRNSLGVFELFSLKGQMEIDNNYAESDNEIFRKYESDTASYTYQRHRITRKQVLSIKIVLENKEKEHFFMDMLASDEVYLLGYENNPVKVIPKVEEFKSRHKLNAPLDITLQLQTSIDESCITPFLQNKDDYTKGHLFSDIFNENFN